VISALDIGAIILLTIDWGENEKVAKTGISRMRGVR